MRYEVLYLLFLKSLQKGLLAVISHRHRLSRNKINKGKIDDRKFSRPRHWTWTNFQWGPLPPPTNEIKNVNLKRIQRPLDATWRLYYPTTLTNPICLSHLDRFDFSSCHSGLSIQTEKRKIMQNQLNNAVTCSIRVHRPDLLSRGTCVRIKTTTTKLEYQQHCQRYK